MTKILIAQPTTGDVVSGTVGYMMGLVQALHANGIAWGYQQLAISDIAFSRNIFASYVIGGTEYTHLLFIDSDMGFLPQTILGLIARDQKVVAAACPKRYVAWDRVREMVEKEGVGPDGARRGTADLMDIALSYNVDLTRFDGSAWEATRDGAFLKVPAVGTGIMLIHRDVFEIMLAKGAAHPRPGHTDIALLGDKPLCDFFSPLITPDGSMNESEDISFCHRWVEQCGGEIWVDVESRILHYGMRGHSGRYLPRAMGDFPEAFG
ncbi:MAG: hypothetical protein AAFV19_24795 [Pseudomonadota bacterium]